VVGSLVGAVLLAAYSLIYSFGFRYRIGDGELRVREGLIDRTERHIPFARIQNIARRSNLLHRAFGVTELRLESGGGLKPEAVMVITLAAAAQIEAVLRSEKAQPEAADLRPPLLALDWRELLRLGLVRNRGGVVIGAIFALAWQFEPWERSGVRGIFRIFGELLANLDAFFDNQRAGGGRCRSAAGLLRRHQAVLDCDGLSQLSWLLAGQRRRAGGHRWRPVDAACRQRTRGQDPAIDPGEAGCHARSSAAGWLAMWLRGKRETDADSGSRLPQLAPTRRPERVDAVVAELAPELDLRHCVAAAASARMAARVEDQRVDLERRERALLAVPRHQGAADLDRADGSGAGSSRAAGHALRRTRASLACWPGAAVF
jgi:hypothetical protein